MNEWPWRNLSKLKLQQTLVLVLLFLKQMQNSKLIFQVESSFLNPGPKFEFWTFWTLNVSPGFESWFKFKFWSKKFVYGKKIEDKFKRSLKKLENLIFGQISNFKFQTFLIFLSFEVQKFRFWVQKVRLNGPKSNSSLKKNQFWISIQNLKKFDSKKTRNFANVIEFL